MEKKRGAAPARPPVTAQRAGRLYRILCAVADGPQKRDPLIRRLKVGARTFFRDIDLLRDRGIHIAVEVDGYILLGRLDDALGLLPFPDPELTFGDVLQLLKGRKKANTKLRHAFARITE